MPSIQTSTVFVNLFGAVHRASWHSGKCGVKRGSRSARTSVRAEREPRFTPHFPLCHDARCTAPNRFTKTVEVWMDGIQDIAASVRRVTIQALVKELQKLEDHDFDSLRAPLQVLRANPVDSDSLQPYLFWNSQHYTRNLIDKTALYELLAICWEVGMGSSIHNHKGQNCWMAAAMGRLSVHNYRVLEEDLANHRCDIVPTDVVEITL